MLLAGGAVTQPVSTGVQIDQNGNPSKLGNTSASNSFADDLPGHSGTLGAIRLAPMFNVDLTVANFKA